MKHLNRSGWFGAKFVPRSQIKKNVHRFASKLLSTLGFLGDKSFHFIHLFCFFAYMTKNRTFKNDIIQ